ncbi:MAG: DUF1573 domain-containing protein [Pirellulaceae bacterium]|nr:DUF1573 domain-containing protein [Pirellulaceae bacterium]
MIRKVLLALLLPLATASLADGQDWAVKMFATTEHKFGSVPHGAKAQHSFVIKNIYKEDAHIASIQSSCGCTTPTIAKRHLKTHETTEILATYNTRAFLGEKSATITVIFDKPYYAEVQLNVSGFIRDDVTFTPGELNFGEVDQATASERTVEISHVGRSDWQIVDVTSPNRSFQVELSEPTRRGGRVTYQMTVRLKDDAEPGFFQDRLTVVSNDRVSQRIRLFTQGRVVSPLTVSPATLFIGNLEPDGLATKQLVVRAKKPFSITAIQCEDSRFEFGETPVEKKSLHFIPVKFVGDGTTGKMVQKIKIETDLGFTATCTATATVSEPES